MSIYLEAADYANFGVPTTVSNALVQEASTIIDGFLERPEGLLYAVDGSGNPASMVNTGQPIVESLQVPINGREVVPSRSQLAAVISIFAMAKGVPFMEPVVIVPVTSSGSGYVNPLAQNSGSAYIQNGRIYLGSRLWRFNQLEVTYVAGYLYSALPFQLKQACANIINEKLTWPTLNGSVTAIKVGDGGVTRTVSSALSADTISLISPWKRTFAP